jgi:hypothetical protein
VSQWDCPNSAMFSRVPVHAIPTLPSSLFTIVHISVVARVLLLVRHSMMNPVPPGPYTSTISSDNVAALLSSARLRLRSMMSLWTFALLACSMTCCSATFPSGFAPPCFALHKQAEDSHDGTDLRLLDSSRFHFGYAYHGRTRTLAALASQIESFSSF